jgi:transcriptional regulator with XRE-family HTH domain
MRKGGEIAKRIRRLRESLGLNKTKFAEKVDIAASRVSEWEAGRTAPSVKAYLELGDMAPDLEDTIWFWKQAGLSGPRILAASRKIGEDLEGRKTTPLPRFRLVNLGMEDGGDAVPIPLEFLPNPASTICLDVIRKSSDDFPIPRGMFIVDKSSEGIEFPAAMVDRVVLISFTPHEDWDRDPQGVYIGRLRWVRGAWRQGSVARLQHHWWLQPLSGHNALELSLGTIWGEALPFEVPATLPGPALRLIELMRKQEDNPAGWEEDMRVLDKMSERMNAEFRFHAGTKLLGEVIGRLSGHIKK